MKIVQLTITTEAHSRLKELAWQRRTSMAQTLRDLLDEHLPPVVEPSQDSRTEACEGAANGY